MVVVKVKIKDLKLLAESKTAFRFWKDYQLNNFLKINQELINLKASIIKIPTIRTKDSYFLFSEFWLSCCDKNLKIDVYPVKLSPKEAEIYSWIYFFAQNHKANMISTLRARANSEISPDILQVLFNAKKLTRKSFATMLNIKIGSVRWLESKEQLRNFSESTSELTPLARILEAGATEC